MPRPRIISWSATCTSKRSTSPGRTKCKWAVMLSFTNQCLGIPFHLQPLKTLGWSLGKEANEANLLEEGDIWVLKESPISFRLSGPNEGLSWNDKSDEEPMSSGDSIVQSPWMKLRGWTTRKEKGVKYGHIMVIFALSIWTYHICINHNGHLSQLG